jgi:hypothetical protein
MLVVAFLRWWYGPGWHDTANRLSARLRTTYLNFSVPILITTLGQPWRRIITPSGGSLGQKMRALVDNAVSRLVGLAVRIIALFAALIMLTLISLGGGLLLITWPVLPLLGPALIVGGLL